MPKELTVLKLGGSLLTDKLKPYTMRKEVLKSCASEISRCMDEGLIESLIILHGVGSFGHPPVLEYKLHKGFTGPEQLLPLSKTQQIVNRFRLDIIDAFLEAGVAVNLMHPSSIVVSDKMMMKRYFIEPLIGYLNLGMPIVMGGDVVYDSTMGFSIGSADQLAAILTKELGAKRLIFATDVNGIYEGDPKITTSARLIREINLTNLEAVLSKMGMSSLKDASGAMKGKVASIAPLASMIKAGLDIAIISMLEEGSLTKYLHGEDIDCTRFVAT